MWTKNKWIVMAPGNVQPAGHATMLESTAGTNSVSKAAGGPAMEIQTEPSPDADRRGNVRIGLTGMPNEVVLSDGTSTLRAECADQSAEGFGLRCEQLIPWSVDQELMLNNGGLWHEVRVAHIARRDGHYQIGLQRLGDCSDYHDPSPLRQLWGQIRNRIGFKHVHILGIGSAFLLCIAMLFIALHPTAPLKSGSRPLSVVFSGVEEDEHPQKPIRRHMPTGLRHITDKQDAKSPRQMEFDQRATTLLSEKKDITWNDLEGVLELNEDQSLQLLSLLRENDSQEAADQIDTTKIVVESRQDFAAFLTSLPETAFEFLSEEQRQFLGSMLKMMSQP